MSTQLALFEEAPRRSSRDLEWERGFSQEVELALIAVAMSRPEDWLGWKDFRAVMDKHQISGCMGYVLGRIARAGLLQQRNVYLGKGIGAEMPGSGNYQGYKNEWRAP